MTTSPWATFLNSGDCSDVTVSVGGEQFRLHWVPLLARSEYLKSEFVLMSSKCQNLSRIEKPGDVGPAQLKAPCDKCHGSIDLNTLPGGVTAFHHVMQFCYMESPPLNPGNVLSVLLAAEYLGMTDVHSANNLIRKCDEFLENNVFVDWYDALTVLQCADENVLEMTRGAKVVKDCQNVIADHATSLDTDLKLDDANKIFKVTNFFQRIVKLPPVFLSGLLQCFTSRNLKFMVLGNLLSIKGHRWLLSQENDTGDQVILKNSPSNDSLAKENSTTLDNNTRTILEWIILASGFAEGDSQESIREQCEASYLVTLLKFAYDSQLESRTSALEEALGDKFHILKLEDLQVLKSKSVQSIVSFYSEKTQRKNSTIPNDQRLTCGLLMDQYLHWGILECHDFHHYFQNLVEAFPIHCRNSCDVLYDAIDHYLEKNWDSVSGDDCLHLCSFLEPSKISEYKAEHAIQNPRMNSQPRFLAALYLGQKKRMSILEETTKDAVKKLEVSEAKVSDLEETTKDALKKLKVSEAKVSDLEETTKDALKKLKVLEAKVSDLEKRTKDTLKKQKVSEAKVSDLEERTKDTLKKLEFSEAKVSDLEERTKDTLKKLEFSEAKVYNLEKALPDRMVRSTFPRRVARASYFSDEYVD